MKPVIEFVDEYNASGKRSIENFLYIVQDLRESGYYEIEFDWKAYSNYKIEFKDIYYIKCIKWLEENYPNDYFQFQESVFFTNKDIVTLMKLSVEK